METSNELSNSTSEGEKRESSIAEVRGIRNRRNRMLITVSFIVGKASLWVEEVERVTVVIPNVLI